MTMMNTTLFKVPYELIFKTEKRVFTYTISRGGLNLHTLQNSKF